MIPEDQYFNLKKVEQDINKVEHDIDGEEHEIKKIISGKFSEEYYHMVTKKINSKIITKYTSLEENVSFYREGTKAEIPCLQAYSKPNIKLPEHETDYSENLGTTFKYNDYYICYKYKNSDNFELNLYDKNENLLDSYREKDKNRSIIPGNTSNEMPDSHSCELDEIHDYLFFKAFDSIYLSHDYEGILRFAIENEKIVLKNSFSESKEQNIRYLIADINENQKKLINIGTVKGEYNDKYLVAVSNINDEYNIYSVELKYRNPTRLKLCNHERQFMDNDHIVFYGSDRIHIFDYQLDFFIADIEYPENIKEKIILKGGHPDPLLKGAFLAITEDFQDVYVNKSTIPDTREVDQVIRRAYIYQPVLEENYYTLKKQEISMEDYLYFKNNKLENFQLLEGRFF